MEVSISVCNVCMDGKRHMWMRACMDSSSPALLTSTEIIMRTLVASEGHESGEGCADRNTKEKEVKLNKITELNKM